MTVEPGRVSSFAPVFDRECRMLVLGTVPSPKSHEVTLNYGNPRNRFWPVLSRLFDEELPDTPDGKRAMALRHHIALWDVLESCVITGAQDSSITEPRPNDIPWLLTQAPIVRIFTTGATATRLYRRLVEPVAGVSCTGLPSTSPANAAWSLDRLVEAYRPLVEATHVVEIEGCRDHQGGGGHAAARTSG